MSDLQQQNEDTIDVAETTSTSSSSTITTIKSNNTENLQSIQEKSAKNEDMSISPTPSPAQLRICLVGSVVNDHKCTTAAHSFGVPVIESETGAEYISDTTFTTYFILDDFDGPHFNDIRKTKHRILGPPALIHAMETNEGLVYNNRPIYNYSMKGVITCFTGIRKKDELTRLVNLIHSMGGSIRKDLNSKSTHLVCNTSCSTKYNYAMAFSIIVIRPQWVHDAWENRDLKDFSAIDGEFTLPHKLKVFEGKKICFLGFSPEERQHMIDVLKSNGGVATEIDDPDCSHVIISNTADHFSEKNSSPTTTSSSSPPIRSCLPHSVTSSTETNENLQPNDKSLHDIDTKDNEKRIDSFETTPKSSKNRDGIVLTLTEANEFLNPNNISPIEKLKTAENSILLSPERLQNIIEEDDLDDANSNEYYKRKRDSFDNLSMISCDSMAPTFNSAKKPKLIRTGSITRGIRRSMSFVAMKNPISNILRSRRNSVDPNASITSTTSIESTFNESIKEPIKEKMRSLRNRIIKGSNKRDNVNITPSAVAVQKPATPKLSIIRKLKTNTVGKVFSPDPKNSINDVIDFKTPLAPPPIASHFHSAPTKHCQSITSTNHQAPSIELNNSFALFNKNKNGAATVESPPVIESRQPVNTTTNTAIEQVDQNCGVLMPEQLAVVAEQEVQTKPEPKNSETHIVKSDWFWYTIQNGYADERDHLFKNYLETFSSDRRESLPPSFNNRKRKRLQRTPADTTVRGSGKRRSSVSDAGLLSVSGSFLDYTASPSVIKQHSTNKEADTSSEHVPKKKSMRYNHFLDLFDTESNYVGILHTIVSLFHKPLEENADKSNALLNKSEVRAIFNNFSPIHDVHLEMLNRFRELQSDWSEDCLIGKIILDHREALIKAYPPYVNFFEHMKETLIQCDKENPRFHAFLKINQAKAECGRQSLQDLMIRPVQRLPSISLLISDILKHTPKTNPDFKELEMALKAIKEVMTHINEDKRKTEGRLALFDIFNDIDNCPPDLVSSHRSFISKCEVTELSNSLSGRDDPIMLFLFTDYMEICKIKKSRFNSAKSPTTTTTNGLNSTRCSHQKSYKHIKLLPLSSISIVYDIKDSPRAFALPHKDKMYSFNICDELDKIVYLKSLCKQLAENACRADAEQFLRSYESTELGIDISDINLGTLKKAFNYARTRLKVTRAFSFNKTPMKLKRAVTTSPLFSSTNSLTPATQLAQMKLASCTNINEVGEHDDEDDDDDNDTNSTKSKNHYRHPELLIAPMSVQPTRKAKTATLSIAELRRL